MHICYASLDYPTPSGNGGGVGKYVQKIGQTLVQQGHRVTVVAQAQRGEPLFFEDQGVRVFRVPHGNLHWYLYQIPGIGGLVTLPIRELEYSFHIYRQVKALHAQTPFDLIEGIETGTFWIALGLKNVPLIIRLHGDHYSFHKYTPDLSLSPGLRLARVLQRMAIRQAKLLTSPSQAHADEVAGELNFRHPAIQVIPPVTALPSLTNGKVARKNGATPTVLFVGRLEKRKGVPLVLEAAQHVRQKIPNVKLVFAGAYHPTLPVEELNQLISQYSLEECVNFVGSISWPELSNWYQSATLCVLPSYYETFGLAALEPMAFGVPVVAARAGALAEVVEHGVTGLLVPPGDAKALASAIFTILQDQQIQTSMGQAGQRRVQKLFNEEQLLGRFISVYQEVSQQPFPDMAHEAS